MCRTGEPVCVCGDSFSASHLYATHRRNTASTSARMEDFRHRPAIVAEAKELALVWLHRMSVGSQVCLYAFLSPAVFS